MKVKHLAIISFDESEGHEVSGSVDALVGKYKSRPGVLSLFAVPFNRDGNIRRFDCVRSRSPPFSDTAEPRDYGAYLVFHNMEPMGEFMSAWGKGWTFEEYGEELARKLAGAVFDRLRFPRLGKVCVVACNFATSGWDGEASIGESFCGGLTKECEARSVQPPLVAGWDDFVSVAFPKNEGVNRKFRNPASVGHKVSQNPQSNRKVWAKGGVHKKVWVWNSGKYVEKALAETNWSDKLTPHATADGKTAPISDD